MDLNGNTKNSYGIKVGLTGKKIKTALLNVVPPRTVGWTGWKRGVRNKLLNPQIKMKVSTNVSSEGPGKKRKATVTRRVSKASTSLKPESRGEVMNYHLSDTARGGLLKLDSPDKTKSITDKVLKSIDYSTTNTKRQDSFYGNKPAGGVSQKVFNAHKAVRDKKR